MKIKEYIKPIVIKFFEYKDYLKQSIGYKLNKSIRHRLSEISVLDTEDSIEYIITNHCSLSRYGDGEFLMVWQYITGKKYLNDLYFQKYDEELGRRLAEILVQNNYDNRRHAVGISYSYYHGVKGFVFDARRFLMYFVNTHSELLITSVNTNRCYLNSELTRFYITRKNKKWSRRAVSYLSRIWDNRDICFIEGEQSRLGVGNDLFDNAKTVTRILCPVEDAFKKYDEILKTSQIIPHDTLVIIALGMTATVLAYDLSMKGYQALDMGHIDIEYEWMKMGVKKKVPVPHKYTNEVADGKTPENVLDKVYESQIIARVIS